MAPLDMFVAKLWGWQCGVEGLDGSTVFTDDGVEYNVPEGMCVYKVIETGK